VTIRAQNERKFYQEIHDAEGKLVSVHEKFPEDHGHQQVEG